MVEEPPSSRQLVGDVGPDELNLHTHYDNVRNITVKSIVVGPCNDADNDCNEWDFARTPCAAGYASK